MPVVPAPQDVVIYHVSGWTYLQNVRPGDTFTLKPGPQHAEGLGVYFSEGEPRLTAAEGARRDGVAAIVVLFRTGANWWRSKTSVARKYGRPITWHSNGFPVTVRVKRVETYTLGSFQLPLIHGELEE